MITLKQIQRPGCHVRVKCDAITKEFGVRCRGSWAGQHDCKVFAGDVGQVEMRIASGKDWSQATLVAVFSRGRIVDLADLYGPKDEYLTDPSQPGAEWRWSVCFNPSDFLKHKPKVKA